MKHSWTAGLVFLLSAALPQMAAAAPIQLNAADWATAASGLAISVEDFESFAPGEFLSPLTLVNSTFSTTSLLTNPVSIFDSDPLFCGDLDTCLSADGRSDTRMFSAFAPGTTLWKVSDMHFVSPLDIVRITVVGGSGTSTFEVATASYYGFRDALGLTSVAFLNLGNPEQRGNYSFDDVATASVAPVPEPTSLLLLGSGIAGIAARVRKRRKP
jgi:hypothetical protein